MSIGEGKCKVYISGPMRGRENYNRGQFNHWETVLENAGYDPVNPAKIGDKFGAPEDIDKDVALFEKVMAAELEALSKCDMIFLLDGWEDSVGAKKELECALKNGLWIKQQSVWERNNYDVDSLSARLEGFTNRYGVRNALETLAHQCVTWHKTLVQSFTGGFIIPFVRELAKMKRVGYCDDRNNAAGEACLVMTEAIEKQYGITEENSLLLPCI